MEIIVDGVAKKIVIPNEVIVNIYFKATDNDRETVINKGQNLVANFVEDVLVKLNYDKNELKTRNFSINEEKKYNEQTKKYEIDGYVFSQNAIFKMDYNNEIIEKFILQTSKLEQTIEMNFQFGLKNKEIFEKELIQEAYEDAIKKASMLAVIAKKEIKDNISTELINKLNSNYISNSIYERNALQMVSHNNQYINSLYPEDIELYVSVSTKWIAE